MKSKKIVGIRYCGGCNPRYDRVALIKRLEKKLGDVIFVQEEEKEDYDFLVLCQGCPAQCAPTTGLTVPSSKWITITGDQDYRTALLQLSKDTEQGGSKLTQQEIQEILPHRYPLCLIDTVEELIPGERIQATLKLEEDLPVFQGHFPDYKIFPGVYLVEAMAQAADIVLLKNKENQDKIPLLTEIRKAQIRHAARPGDQLEIYASLLANNAEFQLYVFKGQIFHRKQLVAECEFTLSLKSK
ncbi:3-hydroxyacyl-ACP dehydratase FabZ [Eubacterium barkeri]|uniref:3-hydroxyacyl-[acyl-carrier-protein] dehydratase n=1 Tax=Eubacterium barkeri TaxID=1528 RepID=A0A1H3K2R7_EUBBA|nr:3-hydroxyacyl-ACP dehydratase FabZ [Eubacterium barkeri]SDY45814.1 3-hydroxyacyl-[acyl-carrier-protein] dehydratase [Eubacterium barkeri]